MSEPTGLAALLRSVLRERNMSERALASELGASANAMNSWVRGLRIPEPQFVWKIAELAHVPVAVAMEMAGHLPPSDAPSGAVRAREQRLAAIGARLDDPLLDLLVSIAESLDRWQSENR